MTELLRAGGEPASASSQPINAAWFLRRAVMAVAILCVTISSVAWLLHASIDTTSAEAVAANRNVPAAVTATSSID